MERDPRPKRSQNHQSSRTSQKKPSGSRGTIPGQTRLPRLLTSAAKRNMPDSGMIEFGVKMKPLRKPRKTPSGPSFGVQRLEERKKLNNARKGMSVTQKTTFATTAKSKALTNQLCRYKDIPRKSLILIFEFAASNIEAWFHMVTTCRTWNNVLGNSIPVWRVLKQRMQERFPKLKGIDELQVFEGKKLSRLVKEYYLKDKIGNLNLFLKKMEKLFDYNSTKVYSTLI